MEIKGSIEEIIYQNETNGYTICNVETEEEIITAVGYLPFINKGDCIKLIGKYVVHQDYGRQFKIDTFEKIMPETKDAIEKYLSGGIIKGIGPATARKIVEMFGDETIYIFKFEPHKLANVKGINETKAKEIAQEFNEKWEMWQIVNFLDRFGISSNNAKKVYDALGSDAIHVVESNPYILIDITYGVDFKKIDKIALELGIEHNNLKRIESGLKYALILVTYNGHTCIEKENLLQYVSTMIDVKKEEVEDGFINLKAKKEIIAENRKDSEWVYLYPLYKAEQNVAEKIQGLLLSKNVKMIKNFTPECKKQEKLLDIELSQKQKKAVEAVNDNNVCIITGGPRNGKNDDNKRNYCNI